MILRSLLFVPGDSDRKLAKAQLSRADALVLDLEDAVAAERLPAARGMVREYLKSRTDRRKQQLWVRVNPLQTPLALEDLGLNAARAERQVDAPVKPMDVGKIFEDASVKRRDQPDLHTGFRQRFRQSAHHVGQPATFGVWMQFAGGQ